MPRFLIPFCLMISSSLAFGQWLPVGPQPIQNGQVQNIPNGPVTGAASAVLPNPVNNDILYIGSVNGGIWKTTNATSSPQPTWTPVGDTLPSLSISTLSFDSADSSYNTLYAGVGHTSSASTFGGALVGLYKSSNAGNNWSLVNGGGTLTGLNLTGLSANGTTLVVSAGQGILSDVPSSGGVWRSTDGGAIFTQITSLPGNLTTCTYWGVAADTTNAGILYTAYSDTSSGGVYKSIDSGASWSKISTTTMDTMLTQNSNTNGMVRLAAGPGGTVAVLVGTPTTNLQNVDYGGLYYSSNGGSSWLTTDEPRTSEPASDQSWWHMSLAIDPSAPNLVYCAGDTQAGPFPNSIGASTYVGRIFRVDTAQPAGSQVTPLTNNASTVNNSAPHCDSRAMAVRSDGSLVEGDDGGVYVRTLPQGNNGQWLSLNGNLQITEIYGAGYDHNSKIILTGEQDVGTAQQTSPGSTTWSQTMFADGNLVAVVYSGNLSYRYTAFAQLSQLTYGTYTSANVQVGSPVEPALFIPALGKTFYEASKPLQWLTPMTGSRVDSRFYIAQKEVYQSTDFGGNLTEVGTGNGLVVAMVAGTNDNPDALFVARDHELQMRTTDGGPLTTLSGYNHPEQLYGIDMNLLNSQELFALNQLAVYRSSNGGSTFDNITGNLTVNPATAYSFCNLLAFAPQINGMEVLFAGMSNGVWYTTNSDWGVWREFGTLPGAPVSDLLFDTQDHILVAALFGRGVFQATDFTSIVPEPSSLILLALAGGWLNCRPRCVARRSGP